VSKTQPETSKIYIVGAGPGAKDLLTLRAYELLKQCDCIIYDNLISDEILDIIPSNAVKHYAGKQKANHHMPQPDINQLLVDLALTGKYKTIIRLKGGDPFIFGRGGEECQLLIQNNISFEVVPAVTASLGCGALANIPLTHRDYVSGVQFITGHGCKEVSPNINWQTLADDKLTLVVYMGLTNAAEISANLIKHGMVGDMPVAVIQDGTTYKQKAYKGILQDLKILITNNNIKSPAIIIIGKVVNAIDNLIDN